MISLASFRINKPKVKMKSTQKNPFSTVPKTTFLKTTTITLKNCHNCSLTKIISQWASNKFRNIYEILISLTELWQVLRIIVVKINKMEIDYWIKLLLMEVIHKFTKTKAFKLKKPSTMRKKMNNSDKYGTKHNNKIGYFNNQLKSLILRRMKVITLV